MTAHTINHHYLTVGNVVLEKHDIKYLETESECESECGYEYECENECIFNNASIFQVPCCGP